MSSSGPLSPRGSGESDPRARQAIRTLLDGVARAVVTGFALYAAAHLYYAITHADKYLVGWHRVVRYYAVPGLLLAVFVLIAWCGSRLIRGQVALYGSCLLAVCFAYELPPSLMMKFRPIQTRLDEALDRRTRGEDVYPTFAVSPLMNRLEISEGQAPLLSNVPDAKTILCRKGERWIDYHSDALGFNNPMPFPESLDLAVVGDSFVHGVCLDRADSLVGQLRSRVPRTLGFGILANGPLLELGTLVQYVRPLKPDTVLWVFYEGNDLADLEIEAREPSIMQWMDSEGFPGEAMEVQLEEARDFLRANLRSLIRPRSIEWRDRFALLRLSQSLGIDYGRASGPVDLLERVIVRARDITRSWSGRLVLVYLPEYQRYAGLLPHRGAMEVRNRLLAGVASRTGVPLIDLTHAFDRHVRPVDLFDPVDTHLNRTGAAIAAEAIVHGLAPGNDRGPDDVGSTLVPDFQAPELAPG